MLNGNYVSIYEIIERVYGFFDDDIMEFSELVTHISDALLLIGANSQMTDVVEEIPIKDYRGILPCNIVYVNQIRTCDTHEALRYTGNSFHSLINPDTPDLHTESSLTYSLNEGHIFTNQEEGTLEMSYRALPVDKDGYPMIPNDIKYKKAVEAYVMERIGFKLNLLSRLSDHKYERLIREYDWYVGAAQSRATMPSVDKMETIKNAYSRLLLSTMAHSTFFTSVSDPEIIRTTSNTNTRNGKA